jgi:hypothetical protein
MPDPLSFEFESDLPESDLGPEGEGPQDELDELLQEWEGDLPTRRAGPGGGGGGQQPAGPSPRPAPSPTPAPAVFSDALARFVSAKSVPAKALTFLQRSKTWKRIVKILDQNYLDSLPYVRVYQSWLPGPDGVLAQGPYQGRRMIEIWEYSWGPGFSPAGPGAQFDLIGLQPPGKLASPPRPGTDAEVGAWAEQIAHEAVHAWRHLLGQRRKGIPRNVRIQSAIEDEARTRDATRTIVAEIGKFKPRTGSSKSWAVERDFFDELLEDPDGRLNTRLEYHVLSERLAMAALGQSWQKISAWETQVDAIDLGKRKLADYLDPRPQYIDPGTGALTSFTDDYPRLLLIRRVIDARWRAVSLAKVKSFYKDAGLERIRHEHYTSFFDHLARYSKVP